MADFPKEKLINFELTPVSKLQHSISSLTDFGFNPDGMARVDITGKGFELTVRNTTSETTGYLFFKSSALINFHCSKPIVGKIIHIPFIDLILVNASKEDDTVSIFQLDGCNYIFFKLGSDRNDANEYDVHFLERDAEIERIPDITFLCEAVITSAALKYMINRLEETEMSQQVLVSIEERLVAFTIGKKTWTFKCGREEVVGTKGMETGQKHQALLIMHHFQMMKEASSMAPCLLVCFLSDPADTVMMRFCLRELGDLVFIYKAERMDINCHEDKGIGFDEEVGSGSNVEIGSGSSETIGFGSDVEIGSGSNEKIGSGSNVEIGSRFDGKIGSGSDVEIGSGSDVEIGSGSDEEIGSDSDSDSEEITLQAEQVEILGYRFGLS